VEAGIVSSTAVALHGASIEQMIDIVVTEMERTGPFDFGDRRFVVALREKG
jgi:hypothetical protein